MPSASFATLPALTADATGTATATGSVLFRGTQDVALETMSDGEHIITIHADGEIVACGVIPALSTSPTAPALPETGGTGFPLAATGATILGLGVLAAGLLLRRGRRREGAVAQR